MSKKILFTAYLVLQFCSSVEAQRIGMKRELVQRQAADELEYQRRLASGVIKVGEPVDLQVFEYQDSIVCFIAPPEPVMMNYIFDSDVLVKYELKYTCKLCMRLEYRKELFRGNWRIDEHGYMYQRKKQLRAFITLSDDSLYYYRCEVERMKEALSQEAYGKMHKVKKKDLGKQRYFLRGIP